MTEEIESSVPKPPEELRKPVSFGLKPSVKKALEDACARWGVSRSAFVERAIAWYSKEIESDPSKLKAPEE